MSRVLTRILYTHVVKNAALSLSGATARSQGVSPGDEILFFEYPSLRDQDGVGLGAA